MHLLMVNLLVGTRSLPTNLNAIVSRTAELWYSSPLLMRVEVAGIRRSRNQGNANKNKEIAGEHMFKGVRLAAIMLLGLMMVACAGHLSESPAGYLDSEMVTSRIKAKLADALGPNKIIVRTYRDEVQLTGWVANFAIKKRAGEIAANVGDIKMIRNDILVGRPHV